MIWVWVIAIFLVGCPIAALVFWLVWSNLTE